VSAVTLIVWPENASVPALAVVQPAAAEVVGAVHPLGTATSTSPLESPPAAAAYVNVIVLPVEPAVTLVVVVVNVPEPSAEYTVVVFVNPVVAVQELWYRAVILYSYVPVDPGVSVHVKLPNALGVPLLDETGLHEAAPRSVPVPLYRSTV
jgi:hypothetical protein